MKRFLLFFLCLLAIPFTMGLLFADTVVNVGSTGEVVETVIDFGSFTGIAAAVSMLVTQLCKRISYIDEHKWCKILVAFASGIVICLFIKLLGIQSPVLDVGWGATVIYGIFAGSVSCGLYDLLKMIYELFFKKTE